MLYNRTHDIQCYLTEHMTYNVMAPNDTAYKRWSCHSGHKILSNQPARFNIFGASRPCGPAGWLALLLIRCNRIEQWVHLRCAGIRQAQYTDTWTCHLHRESRLTAHTDITPPRLSIPWSKPPTHSPPIPPTPPQQKHRHTSYTPPVPTGLVKPNLNPLIHSPPLHTRRPEPNI